MAPRDALSAIVVDSLITDIVHEAIDKQISIGEPCLRAGPCQMLFDILGIMPCLIKEEESDRFSAKTTVPDGPTRNTINCSPIKDLKHRWHSWLANTLANGNCNRYQCDRGLSRIGFWPITAYRLDVLNSSTIFADSSDDELVLYKRKNLVEMTLFSDSSVQTEQPRFRKRFPIVSTPGDRLLNGPVPCEMNRQTIFIDAITEETPIIQNRPPLTDRFCYMLTDFASALYCSLAIMCCCTPSMFR